MFVFEYGGRGGLDPGERELYLFSVLSPDWAKPGETGKKILSESGLPILSADDLGDAAEKVVHAVREAS